MGAVILFSVPSRSSSSPQTPRADIFEVFGLLTPEAIGGVVVTLGYETDSDVAAEVPVFASQVDKFGGKDSHRVESDAIVCLSVTLGARDCG